MDMEKIQRVLNKDEVIVAGHRGMRKLFPENTLLSIRQAFLSGVDMIETDLRPTSDKEIVLMHDERVDRTTDGTGLVRDMTLKQIKSLDAGVRFGKAFEGLKVPTLREFCELIAPWKELLLNIEIKEYTQETVDLSFAILKEYGLMERCVFTAFDSDIVAYMHDAYGVLTQGFPQEYMKNFKEGPDGTYSKMFAVGISTYKVAGNPTMRTLTPELVKEFERMGIQPWSFCPDDEEGAMESIRCGVRLMTCNDPLPALKVLAEQGLRPRNIAQSIGPHIV